MHVGISHFGNEHNIIHLSSTPITLTRNQHANLEFSPFLLCALWVKPKVVGAICGATRLFKYCCHAAGMTLNVGSSIINCISNQNPSRGGCVVSPKLTHGVSSYSRIVVVRVRIGTYYWQSIRKPTSTWLWILKVQRITCLLTIDTWIDRVACITAIMTSHAFFELIAWRGDEDRGRHFLRKKNWNPKPQTVTRNPSSDL